MLSAALAFATTSAASDWIIFLLNGRSALRGIALGGCRSILTLADSLLYQHRPSFKSGSALGASFPARMLGVQLVCKELKRKQPKTKTPGLKARACAHRFLATADQAEKSPHMHVKVFPSIKAHQKVLLLFFFLPLSAGRALILWLFCGNSKSETLHFPIDTPSGKFHLQRNVTVFVYFLQSVIERPLLHGRPAFKPRSLHKFP